MMKRIILTPEQEDVLASATEPVRIVRPDGSIAGWVSSTMHFPPCGQDIDAESLASAERELDSPGPWLSTQEVLDSLRSAERS
jgi:hypothetical protein